jgi:hypothetical protein
MDLGELPIALGHSLNAVAGCATHWRALQARPVPRGTRALSSDINFKTYFSRRHIRVFDFFFVLYFFIFLYPAARVAAHQHL